MRLIEHKTALYGIQIFLEHLGRYWMRLIEHKTALYGIQIFLRTNIDTDIFFIFIHINLRIIFL